MEKRKGNRGQNIIDFKGRKESKGQDNQGSQGNQG